ncbi:23S rRNA (guanosine(2251)-2'-O)-methyltransferase RlmB [Adlercreutzia murintestinalis]|jgi:rRNA methylase, putative, group 3|uniref:23S rRNA (guanosine(2251)-2'-O)-methyltransferase RlmB n=1 Tax=Adlercreutzia murintestinalis TaxID=2941325 RepID=UPI00203FECC5|nr:23S rRNA (guanosine(2251)-2'-O)-methyltransferase RlmB [Adlercreutzia murintestinalis]
MTDYIEGKRAVIEALRSGCPLRSVFVAEGIQRDGLVKDILRKCDQRSVRVKQVSRKRLDDMAHTDAHQGVIAETAPFPYQGAGEVLAQAVEDARTHERALIVVLDHITDAGNLGAIARSAESVGASGIVIPNKRSAHVTAATYKSSAGAISHIPLAQVSNIAAFIERTKEEGFWAVAATEHAEETLWDTDLSGRIVLVMGSEHDGVSRLVLETCDMHASLPQQGRISSLNVAQASTVFMYEWLRQNRL